MYVYTNKLKKIKNEHHKKVRHFRFFFFSERKLTLSLEYNKKGNMMKKNILIAVMVIGTMISAQANGQVDVVTNPVKTEITALNIQDAISKAIQESITLNTERFTNAAGVLDESLDVRERPERMLYQNSLFNSADYETVEELANAALDRYCNQQANNGASAGAENADPRQHRQRGYRYNVKVEDNGDGTYRVFMLITGTKYGEKILNSYSQEQ